MKCDSCLSETELENLYPFLLATKPFNTGFRCPICINTENRLIAKYGAMRDEINKKFDSGMLKAYNTEAGLDRKFLHLRTLPVEPEQVLPTWSTKKEKNFHEGMKEFVRIENEFMEGKDISKEDVTKLLGTVGTFVELIDRNTNIYPGQFKNLFAEFFQGGESSE